MKLSASFLKATEFGVGIGTGAIVTNLVKHTTPAGVNPFMKVAIGIGSIVVSNMVGNAASKYVTTTVEETVADIKNAKESKDTTTEDAEN